MQKVDSHSKKCPIRGCMHCNLEGSEIQKQYIKHCSRSILVGHGGDLEASVY